MQDTQLLHATCVSIEGKAVLIFGGSGSGKSDLALRLIDDGATLVADDQVYITRRNDTLLASHAERLSGLLEVRGVGILHLPFANEVPIALAIKLVAPAEVERLPYPQFFDCLALQVPLLSLHAFDLSTCAKIRAALQYRTLPS